MPTEAQLSNRIEELWLRPDIVWLATRLRSDPEDERNLWPKRMNMPIKFYRAFVEAGCREGVPVELVSHGKTGRAVPRFVRRRSFIEWDIEAESTSQDGIWRAFAIFALIPGESVSQLWCWICETTEEEEFAESLFQWWEPQEFAFARGVPFFAERI